jgi:hypothetical protein
MVKPEKRSGSYSARVWVTDSVTGRRYQKRVTAPTKRALDTELARIKAKSADGKYSEPDTTPLAEYLTAWSETAGGKPITRLNRTNAIKGHIAPAAIGKMPLGKIRPAHVQHFVNTLAPKLAPGSA